MKARGCRDLRPFCCVFLLMASIAAAAQPLPFRRAMQLVVGSGLAKTYGFPLSIEGAAPSVFSVNYQSFLFNPAQREFIRSARQGWMAAAAGNREQSSETLLEAAVSYIQLDTLSARGRLLQQEQVEATHLVSVVGDRVQAGVDSQVDLTRAKLAAAEVQMKLADVEGAADVLRERLAQLSGLPAAEIETVTESIPEIPDLSQEPDIVGTAVSSSPAVKVAEEQAAAKKFEAKGQHKLMLPAVDLVGQYGLFSRFNNYDLYFNRFQRNNATLGVAIRFPFLDFTQRARAETADAEALKAQRQARAAKQQVSNETLKLARQVRHLAAAEQVAQLQYQLSQAELEAIEARIQAAAPGSLTVGQRMAPTPGPRELQNARIRMNDRFSTYLDTSFELDRARLQLLRAAGKLSDWALGAKP